MIEVEEEPEVIYLPDTDLRITLMTQGDWMKGCPEGAEQGFLFSLYSQLSETIIKCPHECTGEIPRTKSDFLGIYVSFSLPKLRISCLWMAFAAFIFYLHR